MIFKVIKYIYRNNKIVELPWRMIQSVAFQINKRITKSVFSKKLFNGYKILLFPNCPISSQFVYTKIPDKKEIELLREKASSKNTIFLDIGANIGSYSLLLADRVKKTYAFEPHPVTLKRCKLNYLLNNLSSKNIINKALSNKSGVVNFSNLPNASPVNQIVDQQAQGICVDAITLDKFIEDNEFSMDDEFILKVDVEGHEKEVLQGAQNFLKNYKVKGIIFECFKDNYEINNLLETLGYNVTRVSENNFFAAK